MQDFMIPSTYYRGNFTNRECPKANLTLNADQWLIRQNFRYYDKVFLMHTVGTGKTIGIVSIIHARLNTHPGVAVIITKKTQQKEFKNGISMYCGENGIPADRIEYSTYRTFGQTYINTGKLISGIYIDEFHLFSDSIANSKSNRGAPLSFEFACQEHPGVFKCAITGTPMMNMSSDLTTMMKFFGCENKSEFLAKVGIFYNAVPPKQFDIKTIFTDAPAAYVPPKSNAFGSTGRVVSLLTYNEAQLITSGISLTEQPDGTFRSDKYARLYVISRMIEKISPIFSAWMQDMIRTSTHPGIGTFYFDGLREQLYIFGNLLKFAGFTECYGERPGDILMLTGEKNSKPVELYNPRFAERNNAGQIVRYVLYSSAFKEGISFLNVLRVYTLPVWNKATQTQSLGRNVRNNSYIYINKKSLPTEYIGENGEIKPVLAEYVCRNTYHSDILSIFQSKTDDVQKCMNELIAHAVKPLSSEISDIGSALSTAGNSLHTQVDNPNCRIRVINTTNQPSYNTLHIPDVLLIISHYVKQKADLQKLVQKSRSISVITSVATTYDPRDPNYIEYVRTNVIDIMTKPKIRIDSSMTNSDNNIDNASMLETIKVVTESLQFYQDKISEFLRTDNSYKIIWYTVKDPCDCCGEQLCRVHAGVRRHTRCIANPNLPIPHFCMLIGGSCFEFTKPQVARDVCFDDENAALIEAQQKIDIEDLDNIIYNTQQCKQLYPRGIDKQNKR